MTDVVVTQPNYLPWRGWFDQLATADVFVLLTDVQYTRRDWRNRNRVKTPDGLKWMTIPVVKGPRGQRIDEVEVRDEPWATSHVSLCRMAYRDAPHAEEELAWLEELLSSVSDERSLVDVLDRTIRATAEHLGITTELVDCRELLATSESEALDPSERLAVLAERAGADRYLTGPAARDYMDTAPFRRRGIDVGWFDYGGYEPYPQLHGAFEGAVSIVDPLVHLGRDRTPEVWAAGTVTSP